MTHREDDRVVQRERAEQQDLVRRVAGVIRAPVERRVRNELVRLRERREGGDVAGLLVELRHERGPAVTVEMVLEELDEGSELRRGPGLEVLARVGRRECLRRRAPYRRRVDVESTRAEVEPLKDGISNTSRENDTRRGTPRGGHGATGQGRNHASPDAPRIVPRRGTARAGPRQLAIPLPHLEGCVPRRGTAPLGPMGGKGKRAP